MANLTLPVGHPYTGTISLEIDQEGEKMDVHIHTERLHLESVKKSDVDDYAALFGNSDVMRLYAGGNTRDYEQTATRINESWIPRWEKGNPFSALAIRNRETDEFIGHIVVGTGEDMLFDRTIGESGYSEMAYLLRKKCWEQGFGKEAAASVVKGYVPELVSRKYEVLTSAGEGKAKSLPLKWLTATSLVPRDAKDEKFNPASVKILTGLGFRCLQTGEKFGNFRGYFGRDYVNPK